MLNEEIEICSKEEPFVSIIYDKNVDALIACTYSKNTTNRTGQLLILDKVTLAELYAVRLPSAAFHLELCSSLYITGLGDGQIALFDATERRLSIDKSFVGQMVTDAKLNCSRIAFTDEAGSLRLYERENSTVIFEKLHAHSVYGQTVNAWCCEFIDDNLLASGGDDNLLKFWDLRENDGRPVEVNKCHESGVVRLKIVGNNLCTGSYDENLRLFDLRSTDKPINSVRFGGGVWDFEFNEERIYVACMYNGLSIVDSSKMEVLHNHQMPDELIYGVTRMQSSIYCCSFTSGKTWRFKYNL